MEQKFKIGDLVKLKSGGPIMTVGRPVMAQVGLRASEFRGTFKVSWFKEEEDCYGTYHQDQLELASNE